MTLGIFALVVGAVLIYSAIMDVSVADALTGKAPGKVPGGSFLPNVDTGGGAPGASNGNPGGPAPAGMIDFDGKKVCAWIGEELKWARANGWKGQLTSGYRSVADQARVCAHASGPCAAPGKSHHQGTAYPGCAADVTNPDQLWSVLQRKPGGTRLDKPPGEDPMHFSKHSGGSY